MSAINLFLLSVNVFTHSLHVPLGKLLQSKYVSDVTFIYSNETIDAAFGVSKSIEDSHQKWQSINVDRSFNIMDFYTPTKFERTVRVAQDQKLVIVALTWDPYWTYINYCFEYILCSYLVIVELNGLTVDYVEDVKNIIIALRDSSDVPRLIDVKLVAILLYSTISDVVKLCFLCDSGELQVLDYLEWDDKIYDHVFREQYKVYRAQELLRVAVPHFSTQLFKCKTKKKLISGKIATTVTGNYVYLATMIGRYLDATVEFLIQKQDQFDREYAKTDEVLPYSFDGYNEPQTIVVYFYVVGYVALHQNDFTEYVILVPNDRIRLSGLMNQMLESALFRVWASAIVVFTIIRFCLRQWFQVKRICRIHTSQSDFVYIFFNTFGLSFGATSPHGVHTQAEQIVVFFVSLFSVLAGNLYTGYLFEQLTLANSVPAIKSFSDLLDHPELRLSRPGIPNLYFTEIFPNNGRHETESIFGGLDILQAIDKQTRNAYMVTKLDAAIVMANDKDKFYYQIPDQLTFPNVFSMMDYTYYRRTQVILQRVFEQGLMEKFNRMSLHSLGVREVEQRKSSSSIEVASIVLADLEFILFVVLVGMLAGLIAFLIEIIVGNRHLRELFKNTLCGFKKYFLVLIAKFSIKKQRIL